MKIHWPWKNLGNLGIELKNGFYGDIFFRPFWGAYWRNPSRKFGDWACKRCRRRLDCLTSETCLATRTWVCFRTRRITVRS